jgi:hypothetical protein
LPFSNFQLNGLSQACGYGDDTGCATNYALVRLRNPSDDSVRYCRTSDHSTMAIATGNTVQSTSFAVLTSTPAGHYELAVVANGIASSSVPVVVSKMKIPFDLWQWFIGSLADGPLCGIGPHGPVPVDPMGPEIIKRARDARRQMLRAVHALQSIGSQSVRQRLKISQKMPRSFDLEAGEGPPPVEISEDHPANETSNQDRAAQQNQETVERK